MGYCTYGGKPVPINDQAGCIGGGGDWVEDQSAFMTDPTTGQALQMTGIDPRFEGPGKRNVQLGSMEIDPLLVNMVNPSNKARALQTVGNKALSIFNKPGNVMPGPTAVTQISKSVAPGKQPYIINGQVIKPQLPPGTQALPPGTAPSSIFKPPMPKPYQLKPKAGAVKTTATPTAKTEITNNFKPNTATVAGQKAARINKAKLDLKNAKTPEAKAAARNKIDSILKGTAKTAATTGSWLGKVGTLGTGLFAANIADDYFLDGGGKRSLGFGDTTPQGTIPPMLQPGGGQAFQDEYARRATQGPLSQDGTFKPSDKTGGGGDKKSLWDNMQTKEYWFKSMSDVPGDTRLQRLIEEMRYASFTDKQKATMAKTPADSRRTAALKAEEIGAAKHKANVAAGLYKSPFSKPSYDGSVNSIKDSVAEALGKGSWNPMVDNPDNARIDAVSRQVIANASKLYETGKFKDINDAIAHSLKSVEPDEHKIPWFY